MIGAASADTFRAHGLAMIESLSGAVVAGFWPIRSEPDIRALLTSLAGPNRKIALPVVVGSGLSLKFQRWQPEDQLVAGALGTANPVAEKEELKPDIMLVPLLAFDRHRNRLGYGGGFYDRTIAELRHARHKFVTIGIAYAGLEIAELPKDPWDQPLDAILTEQGPL